MAVLADVDGFKNCIQVCVWLDFPPLTCEPGGFSQMKEVRGAL